MTSQAAIIISFIIYLVFFGWLGWRRGARREITVFLIALVAWLLLQQEGDLIVNIANLGGAAVGFAQAGGFTGSQPDALAAIGSAPALVSDDARTSFLFVVWVGIFVASYALSNVMIDDKKSLRNGWAILFGVLNGLFFAVAFGPSLVALFAPDGEFTVVDEDGLNISGLVTGGLQMIWEGISSLWRIFAAAGNLGLVVLLTLLLVLAATTIRGGREKPKHSHLTFFSATRRQLGRAVCDGIMGPVELIFISIGLVVTLIGLARGYVKELGSTLIILVAIFILTFFEVQLTGLLTAVGAALGGDGDTEGNQLLLSTTYSIIFIIIVFGAYSGRTLNFTGTPAPAPQGTLISLLIGMFNGYLIAGTLWYYQHAYSYPIGQLVTFENTLTDTATTLVDYLPPSLFDNPVYWIVPVAVLLIIRVRG